MSQDPLRIDLSRSRSLANDWYLCIAAGWIDLKAVFRHRAGLRRSRGIADSWPKCALRWRPKIVAAIEAGGIDFIEAGGIREKNQNGIYAGMQTI
jgi:hypothetical protein